MNLRHLQIFLTVCEAGTMTRAAKILYMTQPSVSQAISELEKEYSVRLFERLNHRLFITPAGEQLRSYANHMLNLTDQVKKELSEFGLSGSLRVGASQTVGAFLLPKILREVQTLHPEIDLFSIVDNTSVIENMILEDQLDLGVVEGRVESPYIQQEFLCEDELVIVCGNGHAFRNKAEITLPMLDGQSFIIRESGSGTRDLFERIMNQAEVKWKTAGIYHNTESIKKAVCENLALAVVPKISISDEQNLGILHEVRVRDLKLHRKFNLIYHRQKYFTHAIETFIKLSKTIS